MTAALQTVSTLPALSFSLLPTESVTDLQTLWRDLESRSECSFFTSWDWIGRWLSDSASKCYALIGHRGERVVLLALLHPTSERRHTFLKTRALMLHQVGDPALDVITIEYNGFLVDRTVAETAMLGALEFLQQPSVADIIGRWDEMHFGGVADGFESLARRTGLLVWQRSRKPSWRVDLDAIRGSGRPYLEHLSANTRYQIRRALRLYEKRGPVTAVRARDVDEALRFYAEMQDLHQRYWASRGEPGSYAYPFYKSFHRELIAQCIPSGRVELMRVAAGDYVIGYVYNFVRDGWVCAYHTGLSYDADPKLKPGLVSHYLCIEQHLQDGAHTYDFLAGDNRYKANLGIPGPEMLNLVLQRPIALLRAETALRRVKGAFVADPEALAAARTEKVNGRPPVGKALVFGDDTRSFLTVVRSLGRKGVSVHVAPINLAAPALRSRYVTRVHRLPPYVGAGEEWVRALTALLAAERFDLVIPCDDRSLLPCHTHRVALERLTKLAIPSPHAVDVLFDKEKTKALAAELGVNLAKTISPHDGSGPAEIFAALGAPVVVKPSNSYRLSALHRRAVVRVIDTPEELAQATSDLDADHFYYENFFVGTGVGLSVLAERGKILLAFQHHRVHEPPRGGAAPYRVSAPPSPELVDACAKMVGALDFTGVAMFEFRRNFTTGAWILLEVNARPWGSLPLPVSLGVDFPYAWYRLLQDGVTPPPHDYRVGIYGRNLVLDFNYLQDALSRESGLVGKAGAVARWLGGFWHFGVGRERLDTLVLDDLRPGFVELGDFLSVVAGRAAKHLPLIATLQRLGARSRLRASLLRRRRHRRPISILFVCYGNICRSPFAEHALRRLLDDARLPVKVASAGTYPIGGRTSPETAIAAARSLGIELSEHRSRYASDQAISEASVVLVFDEGNLEALRARFPVPPCPVILLGLLSEGTGAAREIIDPYGHDEGAFVAVYKQIEDAVGAIRRCITVESMGA
jgi:protein-tyrosine-phosphatase/CelD/BcsL family acetyltransferase involved in cellulose biosynthesis/predicted ATP-grasp superfamily ATP-dependent carboligase